MFPVEALIIDVLIHNTSASCHGIFLSERCHQADNFTYILQEVSEFSDIARVFANHVNKDVQGMSMLALKFIETFTPVKKLPQVAFDITTSALSVQCFTPAIQACDN